MEAALWKKRRLWSNEDSRWRSLARSVAT